MDGVTTRFQNAVILPFASTPAITRESAIGRYWSCVKSSSRATYGFGSSITNQACAAPKIWSS